MKYLIEITIMKNHYKKIISLFLIIAISSCATITNDAYVPLALSFSDGSNGTCKLQNKRMAIQADIPSSPMIRRSDDVLKYDCTLDDGREAFGSIASSTDSGKMAASVLIWDLGITDAITDKAREYPVSFVIPVKKN
mgnify:CR=1